MAATPGARLGPYEIVSALGAGGMGEVYRARDTKLQRDVAIKVLPDSFASDPERLARFTREAQTLAALNHPHIAQIHGLEEFNGVRALVMELVEGEDLSQRIARGRIPIDEALPIAKQVAEALEAAHEQGVIHRDLKPANIKVRADGTVKVLDFGLAKALGPAGGPAQAGHYVPGAAGAGSVRHEPDLANSPTLTSPAMMTGVGVVLGTAAYMSPEQAKGRAVDKRADIWALGCVLYEMLTGRRAFEGDDVSDTLAAVLRAEPDWTGLPADTPDGIRFLLRRCLDKDLNRRLHAAADVSIVIDDLTTAWPARALAPAARGRRGRQALAAAGFVALGLLVSAVAGWMLRPAPTPRLVSRTVIPLPPNEQLAGSTGPMVALSPDGTHLAYVAMGAGGADQIYLRAMDSSEARAISGTERARAPFFSPDGQWLGFLADDKLKKIAVSGGAATLTRLTFEGTSNNFPLWTPDGKQVVFRSQRGGQPNLFGKPADGSGPEQRLTTSENRQTAHGVSPDGRALVYTELNAQTNFDIWTVPLDGDHTPRPFLQTPFDERTAVLSPDGHWLAYVSNESGRYEVYAQPFPGPGGKHQISADGGAEIRWGNRGELFYRSGENREKMMAVDIQTQPTFSAGKPHMLFEGPYVSGAENGAWNANYDVTADGQRFLMLLPKEQPQTAALIQINVVQNWTDELKRLVPTNEHRTRR